MRLTIAVVQRNRVCQVLADIDSIAILKFCGSYRHMTSGVFGFDFLLSFTTKINQSTNVGLQLGNE